MLTHEQKSAKIHSTKQSWKQMGKFNWTVLSWLQPYSHTFHLTALASVGTGGFLVGVVVLAFGFGGFFVSFFKQQSCPS